jgi:uncharacterized RDD family membrane protein YckC
MTSVPEPSSEPTEAPPPALASQEDVLGRRISAALIDLALMFGLFVVVALAIGENSAGGGSVSLSLTGSGAALYLVLVLVYYFALEATIGQTLGKLLLGLRVDRVDGSSPSVGAIALRTLLRIVDWLPFLYLVGFITMMVTGQRRQRLGDLAAKTGVARQQPVRRRSLAVPPVALLLLLIVALAVYRATDSGGGTNTVTFRLPVNTTVRLPHNTVRLAATGAVLLRDDFSNTQSGWSVQRDRDGSSWAYANGRYSISIPDSGKGYRLVSSRLDHPSQAISITAVLRQSAGTGADNIGVECTSNLSRPMEQKQGYGLGIGPNFRTVEVGRVDDAAVTEALVSEVGEPAIKPRDHDNRIRADCFGAHGRTPARLLLYANGKLIAQTTVPHGFRRFDGIGLFNYSDSGGTTALFDDVVVRELKPTA